MTQPVSRAVVEAFYEAYGARDLDCVAEFLADDVAWTVSGPVDVLWFCGTHRGKAAVLDMLGRRTRQLFEVIKSDLYTLLIDGDQVSALTRLTARRQDDGHTISYRLAHFMRFRDGKIVESLSLLDSFDAVEQVLGHPLATHEQGPAAGDLIAV
jgi:ketosteroid isomerase-like protein